MKIHRLYTDKNGESHFETCRWSSKEATRSGRLSARLPATGIIFREVSPDYDLDWHPAPRRQYIINLDAGVSSPRAMAKTLPHRRRRGDPRRGHVGQGHLSKAVDTTRATASSSPWSERHGRLAEAWNGSAGTQGGGGHGRDRGIGAEIARLFAAEAGACLRRAHACARAIIPAGSSETTGDGDPGAAAWPKPSPPTSRSRPSASS